MTISNEYSEYIEYLSEGRCNSLPQLTVFHFQSNQLFRIHVIQASSRMLHQINFLELRGRSCILGVCNVKKRLGKLYLAYVIQ